MSKHCDGSETEVTGRLLAVLGSVLRRAIAECTESKRTEATKIIY